MNTVVIGFLLISFGSNNSAYLDYVFSLNYWASNTMYLLFFLGALLQLGNGAVNLYFGTLLAVTSLVKSTFFQKSLVEPLFIGTVVIHPLLFYLSLIFVFVKFIRFGSHYLTNLLPVRRAVLAYFLVLTLVLGGFWGFQSTVWGYFWVNDTVEWLLCLVLIYLLFRMHKVAPPRTTFHFALIICFLVNLIVIVRLNLLPTRHSFIQNTNLFFYLFFFYYFLLFNCYNPPHVKGTYWFNPLSGFAVLFIFKSLLVLKFSFLSIFTFLLCKLQPQLFQRTLLLHLIAVSFFSVWNVYFFFFQIHYSKLFYLSTQLSVTASDLCILGKQFATTRLHFKDLEGVLFTLNESAVRTFKLSTNLVVGVFLSNYTLVYTALCFFILFVKMVELGLLYATKTFNEKTNAPSFCCL